METLTMLEKYKMSKEGIEKANNADYVVRN